MSITSNESGNSITIKINGRFDFSSHKDFREAYTNTGGENCSYIVDMSGTDYIDSSALGMLLLLREFAGSDKANITIQGTQKEVRDILEVSNFDKLFTLS